MNKSGLRLKDVLNAYNLVGLEAEPLGNGLINHTWKIIVNQNVYVLQRINEKVFKNPGQIAFNINKIGAYLEEHHPTYFFTKPIASVSGEEMVCIDSAYYRLFPFVQGSHTINVVRTPEQAYEAAAQFGKFTRLLSGFDASFLKITLPHFHDLELRYQQFLQALNSGNNKRIAAANSLIEELTAKKDIVETFNQIKRNPEFKLRVTHHDTKISNVLFDEGDKGLCVIDLDTLMPGYFISDVGDMMRTYLSPVSEEEKNLDEITVREDFYAAIVRGYQEEMKEHLTETERLHFFYAGRFVIYMQALRFLNDYLNNDVYYGAQYDAHNLVRAANQLTLLRRLDEKQELLEPIH